MSKVIDERVVSMEFENKDFEKNVNQTIKSLERLKQALNVDQTTKQVENISKSLSTLEKTVSKSNLGDVVTKKFSFLGTVLDQLTRKYTTKFSDFIDSTISSAVSGGAARAQKLADANFMLKGILGDTAQAAEQLDEVMKSVSDSVDGTAYSLDAAATVAAQLAATGMRGGEEMTNTLKGIAGTAAMTSSSFEEIGMIYTKVMAKGHLMGDQVNQLAYRGLNVTEELGKALGKTGDEITKMISKGQIDFKTFSDALYNAFGEHASKANDTYAGSLANLHSALNRITADVQAAKFEALKDVFNELRLRVNEIKKGLEPTITLIVNVEKALGILATQIIKNPLVSGVIADATETVYNVLVFLLKVIKTVRVSFQKMFPSASLSGLRKVTQTILYLSRVLASTDSITEALSAAFSAFFRIISGGISSVSVLNNLFKYIPAIFMMAKDAVTTAIFNIQKFTSGITSFGDLLQKLGGIVAKTIGFVIGVVTSGVKSITRLFSGMSKETEKSTGVMLTSFRTLEEGVSGGKLHNALQFLIITFSQISIKLGIAVEAIKNFVKHINWGYVILIAFSVGIIRLVSSVRKITDNIGKATGTLSKFSTELIGVLTDTRTLIKEFTKEKKTNNFLKIAAGIAIMTGSLAGLVLVVKDADIGKVIALSVAITLLGAAMLAASEIGDTKNAFQLGVAAASLGAALTAIAFAIKTMNDVDVSDFWAFVGKMVALGVIFAAVIGSMTLLRNVWNAKEILMFSASIIPIVLALVAAAEAMVKLNEVDVEGLDDKINALQKVLGAMGLLLVAMEAINRIPGTKVSVMHRLALVVSVIAISYAVNTVIKLISRIPFEKFSAAMEMIRKYIAEVKATAAVMASAGVLLAGLGAAIERIGIGVMDIGLGILGIAASMKLISTIEPKDILKASVVIGAICTALYFLSKYAANLPADASENIKGAAKTVIALGGLILGISVALAFLSTIQPEKLMVPMITISVVLGMVAAVVNRAYNLKDSASTIRALTSFMLVISVLFGIIGLVAGLASQDFGLAMSMLASMGFILATLYMLGQALGKLQATKVNKNVSKTIIAITVAIGVLIAGVAALTAVIGAHPVGTFFAFVYVIILIEQLELVTLSLHKLNAKHLDPKMFQVVGSILLGVLSILTIMGLVAHFTSTLSMGVAFVGVILLMEQLELIVVSLHKLSSKKPDLKTITIIGALVGGLTLIVLATAALASNWSGQIIWAVIGVAGLLFELVKVVEMLNKLNSSKNFNFKLLATIGALTVGLTLAVLAMSALAKAPMANIIATVVLVAAFLAEFYFIVIALNKLGTGAINIKSLLAIVAVTIVIEAIGQTMAKIAANNWQSINSSTKSMSLALIALSTATLIVSQVKDARGALIGGALMIAVAGSLSILAKSLAQLVQYDWATIRNTLIGVSLALAALITIVGAVGIVAGSTEVGAIGIAVVAAALLSLGATFVAVGASAALFGLAIKMITEAFDLFATNCPTYADNISNALDKVSESISNFITNTASAISTGLQTIATGIVNAGMIIAKGLLNVGLWIPMSLGQGILAGAQYAIQMAISLASTIEEVIRNILDVHSASEIFMGIGTWVAKSLGMGLAGPAGYAAAGDGAKAVCTAITDGIDSGKESFFNSGSGIIGQIFGGLMSGQSALEAAGTALGNAFTSKFKAAMPNAGGFNFNTISYKADKALNEKTLGKKQAKGLEYAPASERKRLKSYFQGQNMKSMVGDTFGIDLTDPVKDLTEAFDNLVDPANDAAGALGGAGGAASKAGEQAKHSLKGWQELGAALEDTIDSQMDIFTEFEKKTDLTADQVLHNMRSQIDGVREWSRNLYELSKRGLNSVLVQELTEMGPQGYEKVNAFIQMTDEQLKEANELYAERLQMPAEASSAIVKSFAATGMWGMEGLKQTMNYKSGYEVGLPAAEGTNDGYKDGLGIDSPSKVMAENGRWVAEGLAQGMEDPHSLALVRNAARKLAEATIIVVNSVLGKADDAKAGQNVTNAFSGGVDKGSKKANHSIMSFCKKIVDGLQKGLPEKTFKDYGFMIWQKFEEGMIESFKKLNTTLKEQLKKLEKDFVKQFTKLGEYCADGLSDGIEKRLKKVTGSIVKVCKETIKKAEETVKSNSPSKVFTEIGENITIGLANGITKMTDRAGTASQKAAVNVIDSFQNAVDQSAQYVSDSVSDNMVLTPILDLTQVEAGTSQLTNLLGKSNFEIGGTVRAARVASGYFDKSNKYTKDPQPTQITNNYEFNQTNNSPKALSNAEIYRQTNNLISRYRRGATS